MRGRASLFIGRLEIDFAVKSEALFMLLSGTANCLWSTSGCIVKIFCDKTFCLRSGLFLVSAVHVAVCSYYVHRQGGKVSNTFCS